MGLSVWQILIIVLVVVLLFGAGKIPQLMRDMGSGVNAFKRGLKEDKAESSEDEQPKPAVTAEASAEPEVAPEGRRARGARAAAPRSAPARSGYPRT